MTKKSALTYLVQEAQQEAVPVDELVELGSSNCELDLAGEAEAYLEGVEVPEVVEEKESYLARKLHLLLTDHFHDQTDKDHQVHKILSLQNKKITFSGKKTSKQHHPCFCWNFVLKRTHNYWFSTTT